MKAKQMAMAASGTLRANGLCLAIVQTEIVMTTYYTVESSESLFEFKFFFKSRIHTKMTCLVLKNCQVLYCID